MINRKTGKQSFSENEIHVSYTHQSLFYCGFKKEYLPESFSKFLFDLTDTEGNYLALYKNDYQVLCNHSKKTCGHADISKLQKNELLTFIRDLKLQVIKYFHSANLKPHELDINAYNKTGGFISIGNHTLLKKGHQNCVVLKDNHIYIHPKVRAVGGDICEAIGLKKDDGHQNAVIGVSHSSLSGGKRVEFAGSFIHDEKIGWILENTTGHYGTRITQVRNFVEKLHKKGMDLSKLKVKLWIPKNPKNPGVAETEYDIIFHDAVDMLQLKPQLLPMCKNNFGKKR